MGRGKNKDLPNSMCLLSALYDPVNYLPLNVQTGPTDGNEQDLLLKHLPKGSGRYIATGLWILGTALFAGLKSKGIRFIVRMREHWLEQFPSINREVKCRLVKIALENGEDEILATSLLDGAKYKLTEIDGFYQIRLGTEEGFKLY